MQMVVESAGEGGLLKNSAAISVVEIFEMNRLAHHNLQAVMNSFAVGAQVAELIRSQIADYSEKTFQGALAQVQALASARSPQRVVELQAGFAQQSLADFLSAYARLSTVCGSLAQEGVPPLSEWMTAPTRRAVKAT